MAPEVAREETCTNNKCDIWSIGVILHYILDGSTKNILKFSLGDEMRSLDGSCDEVLDLLSKMIEKDPA